MDASRSGRTLTPSGLSEIELQIKGTADALVAPQVVSAIRSQTNGFEASL